MTRLWSPDAAEPSLRTLAATPRLLVALDFDGTASPLVDDPMAARALPEVREQVERLAALPDTTVAYVSGRSMHDLRVIAEHDDDSPIVLAGSHGAQYWYPGQGEEQPADAASELRAELGDLVRTLLDGHAGANFEPKALGFGVHTRLAAPEVEEAVFAAVDELMAQRAPHWRRRQGHNILEFSSTATGKDAAIGILRERFDATGVLFAGDDVTDEDAMRVLGAGDLGVRVGAGETAATLRVESPQQIALLLDALATERAAGRE